MTYFLEHIAKHLYSEFGSSLNRHCLVFPSRRAGLFFLKYLAAEIRQPVWAPAVLTINELFRSMSALKPAENETLLCELYKEYRRLSGSTESFDDFYFWGDMLLDDFDDVDKYLADASRLFRNIQDIKEIEQQFGGLTEEQAEIVKRFWVNFNPAKSTEQKEKFINIWAILNDLYSGFKRSLREKGFAYEGMIFRDVIEVPGGLRKVSGSEWDMFHFIGFNALNECEKSLMKALAKDGKARFYWDYDNSYMGGTRLNSAGYFMRGNIQEFGNDMPGGWSYDTLISGRHPEVRRRVIDASSDLAQVKLIPQLVSSLAGLNPENAHETAVILADENLLMPVLTSLPENIPDVNITMGYPLKHTAVYTLVRYLTELQRGVQAENNIVFFNHREVISILRHTLISQLVSDKEKQFEREFVSKNLVRISSEYFSQSEVLSFIFSKVSSPSGLAEYLKTILHRVASHKPLETGEPFDSRIRNEFIYRVLLVINRLEAISEDKDISISLNTWISLLDKLLKGQSVPFSGEPLAGIQVMGILETRTLDFRNLIILSVNDGILPAITSGSSFIPFSLREAFGLPSINHRESVYAYHFYRLLHRAENVTFVYNSNPEGLRSGEMSRFLQQMKYDENLRPAYLNIGFDIRNHASVSDVIERTEEHQQRLLSRFTSEGRHSFLSPSAINTWLNCRMKFYYRYVCGLREPEGITEEIDPAVLGTLLHQVMNRLYGRFAGKEVTADEIAAIMAERQVMLHEIVSAVNRFFNRKENPEIPGHELIVNEVLMVYLRRMLDADRAYAPFTIIGLETPVRFAVANGISAGGNIDRVDRKDGVTRIVDYKTGAISDSISSLNDLFTDDRKKDPDGWLQTLLYCEGWITGKPGEAVRPSVYKARKSSTDPDSDKLIIKPSKGSGSVVENYSLVRDEFVNGLKDLVITIIDPGEPFRMTGDPWSKCKYCPYRNLCLR